MTDFKGLRVSILQDAEIGNCSNGGVSSKVNALTIVGIVDHTYPNDLAKREVKPLPVDSRIFAPTEDAPAAIIKYRNMGSERLVTVEPLDDARATGTPWMAGGAYVTSSDSRWRRLVGFYGAPALHDRTESWALYNALST